MNCRAVVVSFVSSARSVHFLRQGECASCSRCPFVVIFPCFGWLHLIIHYVDTVRSKKFRENALWNAKYALLRALQKCVWSDCLLSLCLCLAWGGSASVYRSINISVGLGKREVSGRKHAGLFTEWQTRWWSCWEVQLRGAKVIRHWPRGWTSGP